MDEEDDSYESSSGSEDSEDDIAEGGSDGEANPYADGSPLPHPGANFARALDDVADWVG